MLSSAAADVRLICVVGEYDGPTGVVRGDSSLLRVLEERYPFNFSHLPNEKRSHAFLCFHFLVFMGFGVLYFL